jgi:succinyl-diaminopimelate desuccinylase
MTAHYSPLRLQASSAELTAQICDVESVSGNEATLANLIEDSLSGLDHLEVSRDGDAIIARTNVGAPQRVIVAGHIDTVPVNQNLPTHVRDGYLWGRGTVDMKAGVAIALKLAAELSQPAYDITWVFYDHEEVDSALNGLGRISRVAPELLEADFAILGEPTNGVVEGGCNGTITVELKASGVRAHSARAWKGVNAIHALTPALERLASYDAQTVTVDGLDYRESLSAVGVSGGVAGNVIPDEAILKVNYRFAPNTSADHAAQFLKEMFSDFELTVTDSVDGARPGLDAALAEDFVRAVGSPAQPKYGWTDVSRFSALGIPAVNFGPGDSVLAHADDERVSVSQIEECEQALRSWLSTPES